MQTNVAENESIRIQNVVALIEEKVPANEAERLIQFAERVYHSVAKDDWINRQEIDIYGAVLNLWNTIQSRKPGASNINVYNPNFEQHGWQSTHTVVEIAYDDKPFLVDSLRMAFNRLEINTHLSVHVPLRIKRNESHTQIIELLDSDKSSNIAQSDAVLFFEIDRQMDGEPLENIRREVLQVLEDVTLTVDNWQPIVQKLDTVIDEVAQICPDSVDQEEHQEVLAFLSWIRDGHFTFMGYHQFDLTPTEGDHHITPVEGTALGLMKRDLPRAHKISDLPAGAQRIALANHSMLILTKMNAISTVHRPAPIDYIGVKRFDAAGNVVGEHRFIGLYTSAAYNLSPRNIPLMRRKLARVIGQSGLVKDSHDSKVLMNVLETYPRDELFQTSVQDLRDIAMGIVHIQERPMFKIFVRRDLYGRYFSCLVFVPRERYNTRLRLKIQHLLARTFGSDQPVTFTTWFSESVLARTLYTVRVENAESVEFDPMILEKDLQATSRSWDDNLFEGLINEFGEAAGNRLIHKYAEAFPAGYTSESMVMTGVADIKRIENLSEENPLELMLYQPLEEQTGHLRLKLYHYRTAPTLSEVMPVLENMGLQVLGETPYKVTPSDSEPVWILEFSLVVPDQAFNLDIVREPFLQAFTNIWEGRAENDAFNRLILRAGLDWRSVSMLRAYAKYMRQIAFPFSKTYIQDTLARYPQIAQKIVQYFNEKFKLDVEKRESVLSKTHDDLIEAIHDVQSLDDDRILRRYIDVIDATVRTNFFVKGEDGQAFKDYSSFKLIPARIEDIPLPVPAFEIFVYSPRIEGVHLRGGKVARGGLRWSDRKEDFRTEVLGLVKAQQVKNSVIVPVGAKGGFVCKQISPDADRQAVFAEGVACYKTFIKGLLDVTDNLVAGDIIPPQNVVRHDEDDPYLVVAADKGTATFSDLANEIACEYGFWLGDAFASGGSQGYDHKKMGITARGAWESVKRHFREFGHDTQSEPFTVVGVGDMNGDVFGNGMLLSDQIKLVGAFNHMHIFVDPNPDVAKSFLERTRLFNLDASTWEDYNAKLISKGGGVFSRSAKSIDLSEEMQTLLGTTAKKMTPNEVIQGLLKSSVDLFWNGGIGTYVKAQHETDSDVGDRANDALRINGADLNCRVVGEGGNLGLTQAGRIEYAAKGGRINTDFIDNAGGVDCSDNEVNIKILLNAIVDSGDLTEKQRNKLLAKMTDDVSAIVIDDNYRQIQSLSITESRAPLMLKEHMRFIHMLENDGLLNRELEFLPNDESLLERKAHAAGLTRPELCVLLAYGKMALKQSLLCDEIVKNPYFYRELESYFPLPLRAKYRNRMISHRLFGEIIATQLANEMVNYMGSNFAHRLHDETGATYFEIAECFTMAKEIFNMPELWSRIESLDNKVPATVQIEMMFQSQRMIRRATRWFLRYRNPSMSIQQVVDHFRDGVKNLESHLADIVDANEAKNRAALTRNYAKQGVPNELSEQVAYISMMFSALDIVEVAKSTGQDEQMVAEAYFALGGDLDLNWFLDQIVLQPVENHWQALARAAFREELDWLHRSLTTAVLSATSGKNSAERVSEWLRHNQIVVSRWEHMVADFKATSSHEFAKFSVALRELLLLVQHCTQVSAEDVKAFQTASGVETDVKQNTKSVKKNTSGRKNSAMSRKKTTTA